MKRIASLAAIAAVLLGLVVAYRYYLVHTLREPVLRQLSDPDGAKFRNEMYAGPWTVSGGALCGEVNARNRMGGYVGFKSFSANSRGALLDEGSPDDECDVLRRGDAVPWWWLHW